MTFFTSLFSFFPPPHHHHCRWYSFVLIFIISFHFSCICICICICNCICFFSVSVSVSVSSSSSTYSCCIIITVTITVIVESSSSSFFVSSLRCCPNLLCHIVVLFLLLFYSFIYFKLLIWVIHFMRSTELKANKKITWRFIFMCLLFLSASWFMFLSCCCLRCHLLRHVLWLVVSQLKKMKANIRLPPINLVVGLFLLMLLLLLLLLIMIMMMIDGDDVDTIFSIS